jgi:hypothetical protein
MRPGPIRLALMATAVVSAGAGPVSAQAGGVAAFAEVGRVDAHALESDRGKMVMYGGELVVTLRGTVRAGVDVEVGRISRGDFSHVPSEEPRHGVAPATASPFEFRQTAVMISVFREWPKASRIRALAGGGVGVLFHHLRGVSYDGGGPWSDNDTPGVLHARAGVIGTVTQHLCIRGEAVFSMGYGVMGYFGARAGIGYVF